MRIVCPHCGERGLDEFAYHGDAAAVRPDPDRPDAMAAFISYAFERANPAGSHRELWQHVLGCRAWLVVMRDTTTHAISSAEPARDVALRNRGVKG